MRISTSRECDLLTAGRIGGSGLGVQPPVAIVSSSHRSAPTYPELIFSHWSLWLPGFPVGLGGWPELC